MTRQKQVHLTLTHLWLALSELLGNLFLPHCLHSHSGCVIQTLYFTTLANSSDLEGKKTSGKNLEVEKEREAQRVNATSLGSQSGGFVTHE